MMKNKRKNKYERTRKNNTYRKCIEYICNTWWESPSIINCGDSQCDDEECVS
jgi:hypothetical protein